MSDKVLPLRPVTESVDESFPPAVLRVISLCEGTGEEAMANARLEHARLVAEHETTLASLVAKVIHEKLPPIESWVGVISACDEGDVLVDLGAREQGLCVSRDWPAIYDELLRPPLRDRLDVLVEAAGVVVLLSLDIEPALPVTRPQAEAINLPVELLFAKGEAFTSVRDEPVAEPELYAALCDHKQLLDRHEDELLEDAREASHRHELRACAGVVLSLGDRGRAVAVVTRDKARRVVGHHPFLARKLDRPPRTGVLRDGRNFTTLPIVVWSRGHVSVLSRDLVERDDRR